MRATKCDHNHSPAGISNKQPRISRSLKLHVRVGWPTLTVSHPPRKTKVCEGNSRKCNNRHEDLSSLDQSKTSPLCSASPHGDETYPFHIPDSLTNFQHVSPERLSFASSCHLILNIKGRN
jgi:hypothetical protein